MPTGNFLPQAVGRTKFRVAAMIGSLSLCPNEPSPLPWASRPSSTAEIQVLQDYLPMNSRRDQFPDEVVTIKQVVNETDCRGSTANRA